MNTETRKKIINKLIDNTFETYDIDLCDLGNDALYRACFLAILIDIKNELKKMN